MSDTDTKPAAEPGAVFFCEVTGERIVAPGVSKKVDPKHGQELFKSPPAKRLAKGEDK